MKVICRFQEASSDQVDGQMRFPLPVDTFPTLIVSGDERSELQKLSKGLIQEGFKEYMHFRTGNGNGGVLNKERWKVVRTHEGMTSYQDLHLIDPRGPRSTTKEQASSSATTASTKLHSVLTIGTIEGEFNDMAFGMMNTSTEMMKINASYLRHRVVDAKVLATIDEPTPAKPFQGVYLKWTVSTRVPCLLKKFIRPRDLVFIESTGVLETASGERIGYSLVHSIRIPAIRELIEYQIVRANASICVFFRQSSPGKIELYAKGFVDAMGDIHQCIAVSATSEALTSYSKIVHCGRMKKLNWFLKTKRTVLLDRGKDCIVCNTTAHRAKCCQVCSHLMCSRCSVTKKLSFIFPTNPQVAQRNLEFCVRCLLAAFKTNAMEIAEEEAVRRNTCEVYEAFTNSTSMVSLSNTNVDATSEFFG